MRGRILLAGFLTMAALAACSKKDSLYIDTSKDGPAPPEAQNTTRPPSGPADKQVEQAAETPPAQPNR